MFNGWKMGNDGNKEEITWEDTEDTEDTGEADAENTEEEYV